MTHGKQSLVWHLFFKNIGQNSLSQRCLAKGLQRPWTLCAIHAARVGLQPLPPHQHARPQPERSAMGTKNNKEKRLPLQETVEEQAESTPHTLEVAQVLPSCTMSKYVLGPTTFGTSSCFSSQAPHGAYCNSLSLQWTSFPILPYPWFHFPSYLNFPFYGLEFGNQGEP